MKKVLTLLGILFLFSSAKVFSQNFRVPITVNDQNGNTITLTIGVDPNGTDGYEVGLDQYAPPPPPSGAFDARLSIGGDDYVTDVRNNSLTEKQFHISYQPESGSTPIVLHWNADSLNAWGSFMIVDDITGNLYGPLDMTTVDSLVADPANPLISSGIRILVTPYGPNQAPKLNPINDQTMDEGATLNVPATSTDPNGDNITLTAENLPAFAGFTDNGDGTGTFTFSPTYSDSGTYNNIKVIATDDGVPPLSDSASFKLIVNNVNRAPQVTSISNQTMSEEDTLIVQVLSSDSDGDNITLTAENLPSFAGFTDNGDGTGTFAFLPTYSDGGTYNNIKVIATDDGVPPLSDSISFDLTVSSAPITAPNNLSAEALVADKVNLTWSDNSVNEVGFIIERKTGAGSFDVIDSVAANQTTYTDSTVIQGTAYNYRIKAYNNNTQSSYSDTAQVISILAAPKNFKASQDIDNNIDLTWVDSTENEMGFILERKSSGNYAIIDTIPVSSTSYKDTIVVNDTTYQYRIYAFNSIINSDTVYSDTVTVIVTSVGSTSLTFPKVYSLSQNYPNPFNPSTIIKYDVAKESFVSLKIYDMLGREVKTLVNEDKSAGSYEIKFNASNLSSGIYFYRIKAGEFVQSKKMILLK